jgi:hypothetical protein
MASPSRKAESKQDHLAHKSTNPEQIWALVMDLNGSFHYHKLVPVTIQAHNSVYKHWRDYATTIDISPELQEEPPSEGNITFIYFWGASVY